MADQTPESDSDDADGVEVVRYPTSPGFLVYQAIVLGVTVVLWILAFSVSGMLLVVVMILLVPVTLYSLMMFVFAPLADRFIDRYLRNL